uniref:Uncharacterized protein n=1 Tax=Anguilla anguilla TaxID=7936 RepID=A0A0E9QXG9_ANGAN
MLELYFFKFMAKQLYVCQMITFASGNRFIRIYQFSNSV